MKLRREHLRKSPNRRGWLAPIVALALVVVMSAVALVIDRLWLDMATEEAQGVAESAALAACRELASDDALRVPEPGPDGRIAAAKLAAENVASMNHVAGQPYMLNSDSGDITFGVKVEVEDTGEMKFVETIHEPRSVRMVAQRLHARGNPVALFVRGLTHVAAGEVRAQAEASIDNHVVGFQSVGGARVPMLPLAILAKDPLGQRQDTWQIQIENRRGEDKYRYDLTTRKVVEGSDGIPEIVLNPAPPGADPITANMAFFDVHGQAGRFPLEEQIRLGWSLQDLERRDGRFLMTRGPESFPARATLSKPAAEALRMIIGECRAVMLFENFTQPDANAPGRIQSSGLVAGRVMAVQELGGMNYRLVFQPGVLATHSAVLPSDVGMVGVTAHASRYVYQLKLTQ